MGGLHSGRRRKHANIDECIELDLARLHKQPFFKSGEPATLKIQKCRMIDFHERQDTTHRLTVRFTGEHMLLVYQTKNLEDRQEEQVHKHRVALTSTPCNYGGKRWWFVCPDCHQRVRVLYINPRQDDLTRMSPQCRACLDLHYASQMSSYIDRHKTYERYLLANYGLMWAAWRYDHELETHYLKMTPELWTLRLKSVVDWNTHLLKRIIQCDLLIYRTDLANLRSIRKPEERQEYARHMTARHRDLDTLRAVKALQACIEYERMIYEVNTEAMPDPLFEIYKSLAERVVEPPPENKLQVEQMEQKIVSLEKLLKEVNQAEQKKAA